MISLFLFITQVQNPQSLLLSILDGRCPILHLGQQSFLAQMCKSFFDDLFVFFHGLFDVLNFLVVIVVLQFDLLLVVWSHSLYRDIFVQLFVISEKDLFVT